MSESCHGSEIVLHCLEPGDGICKNHSADTGQERKLQSDIEPSSCASPGGLVICNTREVHQNAWCCLYV